MPATPPADAPLRVLFVEDDDYLREVIGILLEEEGLAVTACGSAEDAQAEFASTTFDMLVTDVSLPRMSGVDLARRLHTAAPATWIVFSSGYSLDRGLADLGPLVRTLPKPFEVEELQSLLAEVRAARELGGAA